MPNVIFATEAMIIEWMKNPVDFESTKKWPLFTICPSLTLNPRTTCIGGITTCTYPEQNTGIVKVCRNKCPICLTSLCDGNPVLESHGQ